MFLRFRCRRKYSGLDGFRPFFLVSNDRATSLLCAVFTAAKEVTDFTNRSFCWPYAHSKLAIIAAQALNFLIFKSKIKANHEIMRCRNGSSPTEILQQ